MKALRCVVGVVLTLGFGFAFATNDLLDGYRKVSSSLDAAKNDLAAASSQAITNVDAAAATLRLLDSQIDSAELYDGATQALNAAKTAVSRRSAGDLAVQSTQVRSVLQRVVYERYFSELSAGRNDAANRYGTFLAQVLGLDTSSKTALANASKNADGTRARAILERSIAAAIQTDVRQTNSSDRTKSFQALARATSRFLIVQDSPRALAAGLSTTTFNDAILATVKGQNKNQLQVLNTAINAFANILKTLPAAKASKPIATKAIAKSTATKPVAKPIVQKPIVTTNPVAAKPIAVATKPVSVQTSAKLPVLKPIVQKPVAQKPVVKQTTPASIATAALGAGAINTIVGELKRSGLSAGQAQKFASTVAGKYPSMKAAFDSVLAGLGRAAAQAQSGSATDAQQNLAGPQSQYEKYIKPTLNALDPSLAERISNSFGAAENAFGLRSSDINVLQGELLAAENRFTGKNPAALQGLNAGLLPFWSGLLRGLLLLVSAIAFAYPLYLLNLAFGGRNPFWRQIAWAITLLILPAMFEGVAWLGSVLAKLTGVGALDFLSAFSFLHNPISQLVWALLTVASLVLATLGFRGIATQFGLIQPRGAAQAENFETISDDSHVVAPTAVMIPNQQAGEKIYEWDEEF